MSKQRDNKVLTNADCIRSMSDKELAEFLTLDTDVKTWQKEYGETLYWLQQPAEEEKHG